MVSSGDVLNLVKEHQPVTFMAICRKLGAGPVGDPEYREVADAIKRLVGRRKICNLRPSKGGPGYVTISWVRKRG